MVHYEPNKAQREPEMRGFLELLEREGVKRYLEIGVQRGLTFLSVGLTLARGSWLVGVDWPGQRWGVKDGTGPNLIDTARTRLHAEGRWAKMVWGNSRDPAVVACAKAFGPYDAVFIDGDHSPEGVRADWENYSPMARIVAFHDIDTPAKPGIAPERLALYGVHRLWPELKATHRHAEFVDTKDRGMGIGVLWR